MGGFHEVIWQQGQENTRGEPSWGTTWSSIRSINRFRVQGGWLLSQTPALEF